MPVLTTVWLAVTDSLNDFFLFADFSDPALKLKVRTSASVMRLHLSLCCSCERPRSMRKASALFPGPPEKCDVTCQMSKMERGRGGADGGRKGEAIEGR